MERREIANLSEFVDSLQQRGRYTFLRDEALTSLSTSPTALKQAAERLKRKQRLVMPRRGFYVIVPLEYRAAGAPPAESFIDQLMRFENKPYYVGLLSAAALHGAAHQQPQEFQVVCDTQLRPIEVGRNRIRFVRKKHIERTPTIQMKGPSGYFHASTPEATAIDLLRYPQPAGHLGNIPTVLAELAENIAPNKLLKAAQAEAETTAAQRLGFLLDQVGAIQTTGPLARWIEHKRPRYVLLRPELQTDAALRNEKWRVVVNEEIEAEV